jgi:hypothetical protein
VVEQIDVAVIGTGWCGGIRAETLSRHPLVDRLHIAEIREERLAEMSRLPGISTLTRDYRDVLEKKDVKAVYICATPETIHYPMAVPRSLPASTFFSRSRLRSICGRRMSSLRSRAGQISSSRSDIRSGSIRSLPMRKRSSRMARSANR